MTVRPLSWACGYGTEMLLKLFSTWLFPDVFRYDSPKKCPTVLFAVNLWQKPVSASGARQQHSDNKGWAYALHHFLKSGTYVAACCLEGQQCTAVCIVLYCIVLCCVVLCCAVLCCAVLCCAVLCCAVLCCVMLSQKSVLECIMFFWYVHVCETFLYITIWEITFNDIFQRVCVRYCVSSK